MPKKYIIRYINPAALGYRFFEGLYEVCMLHLQSEGCQPHHAEWWEVKKLKPVGEYTFKLEE